MQRAMPERWQEALAAYLAEYQESLSICPRPFRAIESTLALLRDRNIPLAIVTGKGPVSTAMSLKHFCFDGLFDVVESGSPKGVVKAEAIRTIVARWRVSPRHVIYVGDAVVDMRAAREAGVTAVGAAWAASAAAAELEAANPDFVFTTAEAFQQWIESRTAAA